MSSKRLVVYIICMAACAFLMINAVSKISKLLAYERDNICVVTESPRLVLYGKIVSGGAFGGGPKLYYIYYAGKRLISGGKCECKAGVTEKEYERRMYGGKP